MFRANEMTSLMRHCNYLGVSRHRFKIDKNCNGEITRKQMEIYCLKYFISFYCIEYFKENSF